MQEHLGEDDAIAQTTETCPEVFNSQERVQGIQISRCVPQTGTLNGANGYCGTLRLVARF